MLPANLPSAKSCAVVLLLAMPGCMDARREAVRALDAAGAADLRADTASFYKNIYASRRDAPVNVPPDIWTRSFNAARPLRITAYPDGFALCLQRQGDAESGLYIIPQHMEHAPAPTAWASYEQLSEGIYWYSFRP